MGTLRGWKRRQLRIFGPPARKTRQLRSFGRQRRHSRTESPFSAENGPECERRVHFGSETAPPPHGIPVFGPRAAFRARAARIGTAPGDVSLFVSLYHARRFFRPKPARSPVGAANGECYAASFELAPCPARTAIFGAKRPRLRASFQFCLRHAAAPARRGRFSRGAALPATAVPIGTAAGDARHAAACLLPCEGPLPPE